MGGAKTAEQNRAGFQKFYDNPVNRFRYLKAKTMTRIDNKERCMLRTLRKYGLIDYYNEMPSGINVIDKMNEELAEAQKEIEQLKKKAENLQKILDMTRKTIDHDRKFMLNKSDKKHLFGEMM